MTRFFQQFRYLLLIFALLFVFAEYAISSHPELGMMLSTSGHTVFKMAYKGHIDATSEGGTMRGINIVLRNPKTRNFILGMATARFSGKFTPDVAGSTLPKTVEFSYVHKSPTGKIK